MPWWCAPAAARPGLAPTPGLACGGPWPWRAARRGPAARGDRPPIDKRRRSSGDRRVSAAGSSASASSTVRASTSALSSIMDSRCHAARAGRVSCARLPSYARHLPPPTARNAWEDHHDSARDAHRSGTMVGAWTHPGTRARRRRPEQPGILTEASRPPRPPSTLTREGPNALPTAKTRSFLRVFVGQFMNPLIYLLLGAAVLALVMQEPSDAIVIFVVVLLNAAIGTFQEGRAEHALAALSKLGAQRAHLLREDTEVVVADRPRRGAGQRAAGGGGRRRDGGCAPVHGRGPGGGRGGPDGRVGSHRRAGGAARRGRRDGRPHQHALRRHPRDGGPRARGGGEHRYRPPRSATSRRWRAAPSRPRRRWSSASIASVGR